MPDTLTLPIAQQIPLVALRGIVKSYPQGSGTVRALAGIDFSVHAGTIHGLIGLSGAGKSTLVRCVSGLEQPDAGQILISGLDLAAMRSADLRRTRRKIGVVFQQFYLLRSRTVAENIALPLELAGTPKDQTNARVRELLQWFGLEEKATQYPAQISGGQKQRVAIARALAARPEMLITDEPTSSLDRETAASVLDLLQRVRAEFGVTILLITHELRAVRAICDRVSVLDAGRIVEEGPVGEVFSNPQSEIAQRLLNARATRDERWEEASFD